MTSADEQSGSGITVGSVGDIDDGEAIVIAADVTGTGEDIAVFFDDEKYFALDDRCSHGNASLADGWIEDGQVECPLHSGKFCLRTGQVQSMPATEDAVAHRVEVRDGEIVLFPGVDVGAS